jgi:ketosteroid isomerase-like protein
VSTNNVLANVAHHLAIRDLLDRYTASINVTDWVAVADVFTEDAVWEVYDPDDRPQFRFDGHAQIAAGIRNLVNARGRIVQMASAPVIDVDGDRATARSTIHEVGRLPDGTGTVLFGTYYDDAVRGPDGEWRFARRRFRKLYAAPTP